MKWVYSAVVLLSLSVGSLFAQAPKRGGVAFVNAVPLETPTEILFNGKTLKPEGFLTGEITSFLGLPAGSVSITSKNGDINCKAQSVTVSPTSSSIVVVYLEETPTDDGSTKKELKSVSVSSAPPKSGYAQRIVLVGSSSPSTFKVNGNMIELSPGVASSPVASGDVKIETAGGSPVGEFKMGESGGALIAIYPDSKGGYKGTSIRDQLITMD